MTSGASGASKRLTARDAAHRSISNIDLPIRAPFVQLRIPRHLQKTLSKRLSSLTRVRSIDPSNNMHLGYARGFDHPRTLSHPLRGEVVCRHGQFFGRHAL